jgi:hypothetical protein
MGQEFATEPQNAAPTNLSFLGDDDEGDKAAAKAAKLAKLEESSDSSSNDSDSPKNEDDSDTKEEEESNLPTPDKPEVPKPKSTWDNLIGAVGSLTNNWGKIVENFKTKRSSTLKQTLQGKGFDHFAQSAQIQISKGIKAEHFEKYLTHLEKRLKVPEERQEDLKMVLEESMWVQSNVWTAFNTLFAVDTIGNTKFCSILIGKNEEKDTYDVVFTDIKADFKLAADTMVINKKLSVLGGIWEDEKDEYVKVPKSLTPDDIQSVLSFFQIVAWKSFADQFGIKVSFPNFDQ